MSRRITLITKVCAVFFAVLFLQLSANAITYTAIASGNFSSSTTWSGGNVPPQTITLLDQINIGAGITVTLDQDLVVNTLVSGGVNVDGSLVSSNNSDLLLSSGSLTGAGTINVDSVALGLTSGFTFTGSITANDLSSTSLNSTTTADITVANQLWLNGSLDFLTNSSLTLSNNATIVVTAGLFTNSGGTLNLNNNYNVVYNGGSLNSGLEVTGSGLQSVVINLGNNSNAITLMTDLTVNGTLSLSSGQLNLGGNDLTISATGDISASGSGFIVSTSLSNVTINATGGTAGSLNFSGSGSTVNNFTVNIGSGSQTGISGTLTVNGALNLTSGIYNFSGAYLNIAGTLTGSGTLYGDSNSDLNITAATGLSTALTFAPNGNNVGYLEVSTGAGTSVSLGSDLNIHGDLEVAADNQFNISDDDLTIMGNLMGVGSLTTNSNSGLYIETASNTMLNLTGTNGTIGNLRFDGSSANTSLTLTGNLIVAGSLDLENGALVLAGNDITVTSTGDIDAGGTGTVVSTSSSNITINATGGTTGSLSFSGTANSVNDFIVNVGAGSETGIDGDLTINGALTLTSGTFNFSDADLTLAGTLNGSGSLYGNSNSDLNITAATGLNTDLNFAMGGQNLNDLFLNIGNGSSIGLGTALVINGDLFIATGTQFDITDELLTVNGSITGSGTLTTNSGSGIVLNTGTNTTLRITGTTGTIGTLGFNGSNANTAITLTGDLTVATSLSLQGGTLDLNDNDLNISGDIAAGGSGTINSSASSSVSVSTTTTPTGGLSFNSNGNTVDDFTVNVGPGNSLDLNTDLTVAGQLQLQGGTLDIDGNDLTIGAGGSVTGASENNYVNTSGGGRLQMSLAANTSATFDVGTDNSYAPATVELNNGSAAGSIGVSVLGNVMVEGTAGSDISASQPLVDATWHVTSDITANLSMDLQVMWSSDMEVNSFDRANAYISHYTSSNWDVTADAAATAETSGMFSLRRDNLTSLSPFAVFDGNTITTNITEAANALEFRMFPNPSTTNMIINCPEANNENLMVDIMNIQGGIVKSYNITSDNYSIPVSELANGSYVARVYNAKVNGVQKFTKM